MWRLSLISLALALLACGPASPVEEPESDRDPQEDVPDDDTGEPHRDDPEVIPGDPNAMIPDRDAEGCHGIYAQDLLPTFELEIAPEELAALWDEWEHGVENELREDETGEDFNPYHPVERFQYGDIVIEDAMVRLRGNPDWWISQNKLQLQVSFNEKRSKGRFLGLRKLALDAATYNRTFLRDRLALRIMRDAGLPAPCANNVRVYINGQYEGLYTNVEKIDKEYLQARFEDPDGDLWKRGSWKLQTNEDVSDDTRIRAARDAETLEELSALMDMGSVRSVAAAEAVLPDADGFWAGGLNFYLYDDPLTERIVVLAWDLDNTFWRLPHDVDPLTYKKTERFYGRPWYDLMVGDPAGREAYVDELARIRAEAYDPEHLSALMETWSAQIEDAAFEDYNKPFTNARYLSAREQLDTFVRDRAAYLDGWISCWRERGGPCSN